MTLVFDSQSDDPGTHALIVASGYVPRYPSATSTLPLASATAFGQWLLGAFRNPAAELESLELLGSAPEWATNARVGSIDTFELEPPRSDLLRAAFERWRARLDRDSRNLALLYYAGFAFRGPETLFPLHDFAEDSAKAGSQTLTVRDLLAAARANRAQSQLVIVDGITLDFGSVVANLDPEPFDAALPDTPFGTALFEGDSAESVPDRPTQFCRALIDLLGRPGQTDALFVSAIAPQLREALLGTGGRLLGYRLDGANFAFHYPNLPAQRTHTPAAKAGPTAKAHASSSSARDEFPATEPAHSTPEPEAEESHAEVAGKPDRIPVGSQRAPRKPSGRDRKPAPPPKPPPRPTPAAARNDAFAEADPDFVSDDAETERDELGRAGLAIVLARRLHQIWRNANLRPPPAAEDNRAAFVVHLDAPWGGGKTTFANFLARVLNPCPPPASAPAGFLRRRFPGDDVAGIFLEDPPASVEAALRLAQLPADARRPWIVVSFNAWQAEHVAPPWWVFYQTIRKSCFKAIRSEGDDPWEPRRPGEQRQWWQWVARPWRSFNSRVSGQLRWLYLGLREYLWRLSGPKLLSVVFVAVIGSIILLLLSLAGLVDAVQLRTWIPVLSGALAGLWGLAAFFTESLAPGTATIAERLTLGVGDPFVRFRVHFARMMERVRRPVMVIVDDLDRCRPDFVVDLIRGIQTLLRSPRVVFVILGDRDWIERAFEAHHEAMKAVDVGPEQTFGARFVEKAIQMSFILPAIGPESHRGYVRQVLIGDRLRAAPARASLSDSETTKINDAIGEMLPQNDVPLVSTELVEKIHAAVAGTPESGSEGSLAPSREQVARVVNERLASRVVADKSVEADVILQLERLAPHFPANPRQIKRIVNAITLYYAVVTAIQGEALKPTPALREQLALWVIIMTEWPKTWRLLASFPDLVDILTATSPAAAMKRTGLKLPGSPAATRAVLEPVRADSALMTLITGKGEGASHAPLTTERVRLLVQLTPLHSRRRRLDEPSAESAAQPQAAVAAPARGRR